jgi:D-alanine-D-alanine ligase
VRLGILFGGRSGEHEVSLSSASSVIRALDPLEFEIVPIGIRRDGKLATESELQDMLPRDVLERVGGGSPHGRRFPLPWTNDFPLRGRGDGEDIPEIFFPLLHGPFGEDGTIQGLLEMAGVPYIGCGVLASAVGMDKDVMKRLFCHAALPVVPHRVELSRGLEQRLERVRGDVEDHFGYPVFTKPANLGSSVGVFKVHNAEEFDAAVLTSARFDQKVVIEKGIDCRELECAVLGNADAAASGVGEVIPGCEFYDYEAKYASRGSRTIIPAAVTAEVTAEVRRLALRAFEVIEGSGLARVDFFLDRRLGTVWLNEINTMPGFTPISMYPKLWEARGIPFEELIRRLIALGFERHREREGVMHSRFSGAGGVAAAGSGLE